MRLVLRRARGARGVLLAAVVATLVAVSFVVGLLAYGRDVVAAAARSTVAAAPAAERSLLVRGTAGAGGTTLEAKDTALRAALRDGVGGQPVTVSAAGYSVGRQLTGPVGSAVGDADGTVFGLVMFIDDLDAHADLVSGAWPRPGAATTEVGLAQAAATVLGVHIGDRLPIADRHTGATTEVTVVGVWVPRDPADAYWLLAPTASTGGGGSSYGPITLAREDFLRTGGPDWATDASVGWSLRPDFTGGGLAELTAFEHGVADIRETLPATVGLAGSAQLTSGVDQLVDRLAGADLVGRSALLTPVLLIVVLGGYTLLLIARLLSEFRRGETALIRARGGARIQVASLAAREATLVVAPAALLAPPLATMGLSAARRLPLLGDVPVHLSPTLAGWVWTASALASFGCLVAMVGPSLRRSTTYVAELATRSRPGRLAFAQRASLDLALVALAALAWVQLRQYASPLAGPVGALGIDPLLVAAPTIGVLAGAVLSLRALPWLTRAAERVVDRRHWPATMFGMWQAGRRPQAGPVLLLALAVAVSTLAWCLLGTGQRSIVDQADFAVGADLRLVELDGAAPTGRTARLAALPGAATVAPVSRESLSLGPENTSTTVIGIDPARASTVVRYRADLLDATPATLFAGLAAARPALPVVALPTGTTRLAADLSAGSSTVDPVETSTVDTIGTSIVDFDGEVLSATVTLLASDGQLLRVDLGEVRSGPSPRRVEVPLPADPTLSIVRFDIRVITGGPGAPVFGIQRLEALDPAGRATAVDLHAVGDWQVQVTGLAPAPATNPAGGGLSGRGSRPDEDPRGFGGNQAHAFGLAPRAPAGAVPVAATAPALQALRVAVGDTVRLTYAGVGISVRIVAQVVAVPGASQSPAAMLADLASLSVSLGQANPRGLGITEHWLAASPGQDATLNDAALAEPGLRVLDRSTQAAAAGHEPYGIGGRSALFAAALGALLLALIGLGVEVGATAPRRLGELAVLQTMGAGARLLARSVVAEQAFLAGLGVVVGLGVGVGVAATMAPLVILTPTADRPQPVPLLALPWLPVLATAGALFVAALVLSAGVVATLGRRLAAARLRIGADR